MFQLTKLMNASMLFICDNLDNNSVYFSAKDRWNICDGGGLNLLNIMLWDNFGNICRVGLIF